MRPRARFSLPAGWLDQNGAREHGVELRALCGADEEWIHSLPGETRQVSVAAALLTRCLRRIGARRASPAMIRELTVGDTDFLLLRLWELTFGHRVELVLHCPRGACGAKMDVDFTLRALPIEPCRGRSDSITCGCCWSRSIARLGCRRRPSPSRRPGRHERPARTSRRPGRPFSGGGARTAARASGRRADGGGRTPRRRA
jgi:hypothetical protein